MFTSQKKRLGRGTGSGLGKTSGRGHKGQKARAGKAYQMIVLSSFFQIMFSLASSVGSPEMIILSTASCCQSPNEVLGFWGF